MSKPIGIDKRGKERQLRFIALIASIIFSVFVIIPLSIKFFLYILKAIN